MDIGHILDGQGEHYKMDENVCHDEVRFVKSVANSEKRVRVGYLGQGYL
jgi:hypothetical protein